MGEAPGFIIVGAQKCGTTSLFRYLSAQPGIFMPKMKEVHFFDQYYQRGYGWYLSQFQLSVSQTACISGEATPLYMFHPHAMRRIRDHLPMCRIIALLRNPVDRAYSHYHHEVQLGNEHRSFENALIEGDSIVNREREKMLLHSGYFSPQFQSYSYLSRGRYYEQLKNVFELFPRDQILIMQSEKLFEQPESVIVDILAFLRITGLSCIKFGKHFSRSYPPMAINTRNELIAYYLEHNEKLFSLLGNRFSWD